jgi:hypothetical protein
MPTTLTQFYCSRIYSCFPDSGIPCLADEYDVDIEGVCASSLLKILEDADVGLNIVILNACRNDPFKASSRSSIKWLEAALRAIGERRKEVTKFQLERVRGDSGLEVAIYRAQSFTILVLRELKPCSRCHWKEPRVEEKGIATERK